MHIFFFLIYKTSHPFPTGKYIVATGTHAVAVVNGDYYDAWDSGHVMPIYYYTKEGE